VSVRVRPPVQASESHFGIAQSGFFYAIYLKFVSVVDNFYCERKSRWTNQTLITYKNVLEFWLSHNKLESIGIDKVNSRHFKAILNREGIKATTKHYYYRHFKSFWSFVLEEYPNLIDMVTPLKKNIPAKRDNTRPKMLTDEEFEFMVAAFKNEEKRKRSLYEYDKDLVQNWFLPIMALLMYAGLRRSEVTYDGKIEYSGLKGRNLIYENGKPVYIALPPTKGRTERIVPISPKLSEYLEPYLQERGAIAQDSYVFLYKGGNFAGEPVRGKKLYEVFKRYLAIAGIESTRTLHGMRHRAVTTWIEMGFNTAEAKIMAGHSSISVTEGYTHLTGRLLKEKMDRL
jgi:integrase